MTSSSRTIYYFEAQDTCSETEIIVQLWWLLIDAWASISCTLELTQMSEMLSDSRTSDCCGGKEIILLGSCSRIRV